MNKTEIAKNLKIIKESVDIILKEAKTKQEQFGETDINWEHLNCFAVSLIIHDNAHWCIKISIDEGFSSTEQLRKFILDKLIEYEVTTKDESRRNVFVVSEP